MVPSLAGCVSCMPLLCATCHCVTIEACKVQQSLWRGLTSDVFAIRGGLGGLYYGAASLATPCRHNKVFADSVPVRATGKAPNEISIKRLPAVYARQTRRKRAQGDEAQQGAPAAQRAAGAAQLAFPRERGRPRACERRNSPQASQACVPALACALWQQCAARPPMAQTRWRRAAAAGATGGERRAGRSGAGGRRAAGGLPRPFRA